MFSQAKLSLEAPTRTLKLVTRMLPAVLLPAVFLISPPRYPKRKANRRRKEPTRSPRTDGLTRGMIPYTALSGSIINNRRAAATPAPINSRIGTTTIHHPRNQRPTLFLNVLTLGRWVIRLSGNLVSAIFATGRIVVFVLALAQEHPSRRTN
jgi:hypothetical protein